jgi:LysM repeat protein
MWTKSACVVLAWSILLIVVATVCGQGSIPQARAQANIRIASSSAQVTLASTLREVSVRATAPAGRYVVQPGDTLSGIAAQLFVRGGWPALYAANRPLIGPDPDIIRPGTVLVLPSQQGPARYRVMAGDTLSGIAAALAVPGGWPALYAANRPLIGPDPDVIRAGTVLTIPRPPAPSTPRPVPVRHPAPPRPGPVHPRPVHPRPVRTTAPAAGMPQWLTSMLLAAGVVIGLAFLAELVLVASRRRRRAVTLPAAGPAPEPGCGQITATAGGIVMADYDRLVVTCTKPDDTVLVLRPPGQDPKTILGVARLVLPEARYAELASHLGMPASWPIVIADHDRLVVTSSKSDDTVLVLRPPGEDPRAVLRAARLVLTEGPYEELADQLGESAGWPME